MIPYFDTSFVIKLYIYEPGTYIAARVVAGIREAAVCQPMLSWLSDIEVSSALHGRAADTNPLKARVAELAFSSFLSDRSAKIYQIVPMDEAVFERARGLAERYGRKYRARALDILHVAAALHHGATAFGTFDGRQARMAEDEGLYILR